ncbi:hypothetical protein M513_12020 [Trichuris suis]|uniref:BED-type domain-containing protein n=1 Tax=Trichuris suis TaxID=68888 RepID=A0A085LQ64_9BILA|nr:hypothetical protein M513_12020 [Trichuris suis]
MPGSLRGKKKCRLYSSEYLQFGFAASPANEHLPMCLLCEKVFSNDTMKPSKLKLHFTRCHPDKNGRDVLLPGSARKANEKANIEQYVIVSFGSLFLL